MKKKRPNSCNVLEWSPASRHLWRFALDRDKVSLESDEVLPPASPLPERSVAKDWSNLFQPKLNIAWLPPEHVFLRVVQLPAADRDELRAMLEFQMEKLSPLPLAQVVWSAEVVPTAVENMQTAVVCIVAREVVEEFLGTLEADQFLTDRLEVPLINQIVADGALEDGAWIYPEVGGREDLCLVAWWAKGTLHELQLHRLPVPSNPAVPPEQAGNDPLSRANFLYDSLLHVAWAGEVEGWVQLPVRWHLVADERSAEIWQPLVSAWSDDESGVDVRPSLTTTALAEVSAARAASAEDSGNLLPGEYETKYRQQYVDRLWMRGLGALVAVYLAGVFIYLVALQIYSFRQGSVQNQIARLSGAYTNVLQLKERVELLQEQVDLKYAALDCLKVTAELLPADLKLENIVFGRAGRELHIYGTAPAGQESKITEYNDAMRNAVLDGKRVFRQVSGPNSVMRTGASLISWNFHCELNIGEQ